MEPNTQVLAKRIPPHAPTPPVVAATSMASDGDGEYYRVQVLMSPETGTISQVILETADKRVRISNAPAGVRYEQRNLIVNRVEEVRYLVLRPTFRSMER